MDFIKELLVFLGTRKRFWMVPLFIVLALFALIIVLGSVSALAPFIYTLF